MEKTDKTKKLQYTESPEQLTNKLKRDNGLTP
jgi:hypothetical protein